jgi:mannose-1-phosphate guanylyltransferase/phosphomannomutase
MSKALLICPSERSAVAEFSQFTPLAATPLLGESLLEYWLTHLALAGIKDVRILASDRPEHIAKLVGNGARWGLKVEVTPEIRELSPALAQVKYADELPASAQNVIAVLDHFPGATDSPLFDSYANLFSGLTLWIPQAKTVDRVGMREVQPGIWLGHHAHVSPEAQLRAPCWIGKHVYVGAHCIIGPMAILEDRSFVEAGAEIASSVIGADTFVGKLAALRQSFAFGNTLVNWSTGSVTHVSDAFLLCALKRQPNTKTSESFLHRLFEVLFTEERPAVDPLEPINEQGRAT